MRRLDRRSERGTLVEEFVDRRRRRDLGWLIAGVSIGSAIALLMAPRSGEEVRHAIGRRYRKTVRHIGRHTEDLRDRAEDLLERAYDLRERSARLFPFIRAREVVRRYRQA
jgi:hypothetical protein